VVRKPWSVEPVKVVAAKNKKKDRIEMGKPVDDDDDWLDGFTVTVVNNYSKTVTAMTVDMLFPREPGDSRYPAAWTLSYGPDPFSAEYLQRDHSKVIKPGETGEIRLSPENYRLLTVFLRQAGFPSNIHQVELQIAAVGFEDGSALYKGTFYEQDPHNPNDPTKKTPVKLPIVSRNSKIANPSGAGLVFSHHSLPKKLMSAYSAPPDDECKEQAGFSVHVCFSRESCNTELRHSQYPLFISLRL